MKITINTDNDAFRPRPEREVARILRDLATRINNRQSLDVPVPYDGNGNVAGRIELTTAENPQTVFDF